METNQEEIKQEEIIGNQPEDGKKTKVMSIVVIVILLLFPIIFILYKTIGNSDGEGVATNQAPQIDISAYENAANSNPTFNNLLNLSNAYINSNMAEKSIGVLRKAVALNPNSASAYNNLGVAYTMLQQYQRGIDACMIALRIDSTFQLAKNNLAWAKDEQNKLNKAIQQMELTPEDKRDTQFYINYGLYYLKLENWDKCIEIWNKILETDPKNSIALNNIGTAYMMKLQYDEAIKVFKQSVENNPNDQLSKNNLNWAVTDKANADTLQKK